MLHIHVHVLEFVFKFKLVTPNTFECICNSDTDFKTCNAVNIL